MSKHTPGPWRFRNFGLHEITTENGVPLTHVYTYSSSSCKHDLPAEANARLIAAAPDMLEKLKAVINIFEADESDQGYYAAMAYLMPELKQLVDNVDPK